MEGIAHQASDRGVAQGGGGASTCTSGAATGCLQICRWQLQVADWSSERGRAGQSQARLQLAGSKTKKWGGKWRQREDRHRDWVFKVCEKTRGLTEAMVSLCVTLEAHFSLDGAAGPTGSSGADRGVDRPELLHR